MEVKCVIVAALLGLVVASPVQGAHAINKEELLRALQDPATPGAKNVVEDAISDALEGLREMMLTGSDDVPVLDPFRLNSIYLDDQTIPVAGASVAINGLTVKHLSTFVVDSLSSGIAWPFPTRYNVALDMYIPTVDVDVDNYDFKINIFGLDAFGTGVANLQFSQPRVKLNTQVGVSLGVGSLTITVREFSIAISLSDAQFTIQGMFGSPTVDEFVSSFLRNLILEMVEVFSDDITQTVSPIVKDIANTILADLNLIDLIGS